MKKNQLHCRVREYPNLIGRPIGRTKWIAKPDPNLSEKFTFDIQ